MSKDYKPEYATAVTELRRMSREAFDTGHELVQLRQRIATERTRSYHRMLDVVSKQAGIDLQPILDDMRRQQTGLRRDISDTLARLEAQAVERAVADKNRFHGFRARYLTTFGQYLAAQQGQTELKFHSPRYVER